LFLETHFTTKKNVFVKMDGVRSCAKVKLEV